MGLLKSQREIIIGMILGDAYIQPTGKRNARLRLEHSVKEKEYIFWKYKTLKNMMQAQPKLIKRFNPFYKKQYSYWRCQSHSSPIFGKLRRKFYSDDRKIVPDNIKSLLKSTLTLAVWCMDDGYFYKRDKHFFLYLPPYTKEEVKKLKESIEENFDLHPEFKIKKKGSEMYFLFNKKEKDKLMSIIMRHLLPLFKERFSSNPVTTSRRVVLSPQ